VKERRETAFEALASAQPQTLLARSPTSNVVPSAVPVSPSMLPVLAVVCEERPPMPVMQPTPDSSDATPVS
jgi:hypothetical protein